MNKLFVNLDAIKHNLEQIQNYVGEGVLVMPILKANAYGIGFEQISKVVKDCTFVGVADMDEATRLQELCPNANIFILYQPGLSQIPALVQNKFHITVSEPDFLVQLDKAAQSKVHVHVSVDTGHGSLGIVPEDVEAFIQALKQTKNIKLEGVSSHFALFPNVETGNEQVEKFKHAVSRLEKEFGVIKYKHICSGLSLVSLKHAHFDMVRPGTLLYGYYDEAFLRDLITVRPSLSLFTNIISIRTIRAGSSIGYARKDISNVDRIIATLPIGYADGLGGGLINGGYFLVAGHKAPVVGGVCMNICTIDVSHIRDKVKIGDPVTIFDEENLPIEQLAEWCNIGREEFMTKISSHIAREIKKDPT